MVSFFMSAGIRVGATVVRTCGEGSLALLQIYPSDVDFILAHTDSTEWFC